MASPVRSSGSAEAAIFYARLPESVAGSSGSMASHFLRCGLGMASMLLRACLLESVAGSSGSMASHFLRCGLGMASLLLRACLLCFSPELQPSWWRQARECARWRCCRGDIGVPQKHPVGAPHRRNLCRPLSKPLKSGKAATSIGGPS
jgi:hypothetical protein